MGKRGRKRSKTGNPIEKAETESSHGDESKRLLGGKARLESSHGKENKRLLGEEAGSKSSHGEENKNLLGFACPDCCEYELDLARDALKYYQDKNEDGGEYEVVQVLAVNFDSSWPVSVITTHKELCHVIFSAKPKNNSDASLKWFFAEFRESADGDFLPFDAVVLDPYDDGIVYGCAICPPHLLYPHPRGLGFYIRERVCGRSASRYRHQHRRRKEG